jgi:hypothetical protein
MIERVQSLPYGLPIEALEYGEIVDHPSVE